MQAKQVRRLALLRDIHVTHVSRHTRNVVNLKLKEFAAHIVLKQLIMLFSLFGIVQVHI